MGIVEAVGVSVTTFEPGDQVFGVTNPRFTGAYAEFAVVFAGMIAKKPARLGDIEAAPFPSWLSPPGRRYSSKRVSPPVARPF